MLEAKRFGALPRSAERTYDRTPEEKQLFRYAHRGKKIPYCILTNFERLHVFNADHEVLILSFDNPTEYLDRLDELQRLSPDKVKAGSLQDWERKREITPIDKEFLTSLQDWRLRLANTIYKHNLSNSALQSNGSFDFGKLMPAVQRILDRLILIRYADDKEVLKQYDILHNIVSSYHNLGAYSQHDHLTRAFIELSHSMDSEHNTTLFQPGHLCEQVSIPNEVLASIITEMNNISFRKFTSDILGNTYETYLGTKLALKNGEIKSEERRDIRKAGGIFYTPTFIVHYIVDNTLGQLLKELESQHGLQAIEKAQEVRALDPACGSGSFLIYAYQVLADFYRRMNKAIENEQVKLSASVSSTDMFQRLELFKQLPQPLIDYPHHILEKQLYGVDIDPEAAEIAAVNLTMQAFADTKREKLPLILNENIKVGNSLISGTEEELRHYFGDDWEQKKPFNWEQEFQDIMANGGFDVVIGNPPYIDSEIMTKTQPELREFCRTTYESAKGNWDMFCLFLECGLTLLKKGGYLGMIVPNKLLSANYCETIRKIIQRNEIKALRDYSKVPVFGSSVYPVIIIVQKRTPTDNNSLVEVIESENEELKVAYSKEIRQKLLEKIPTWSPVLYAFGLTIVDKIMKQSMKLKEVTEVYGASTVSEAYKIKDFFKELTNERNYFKFINTGTIDRYRSLWGIVPAHYLHSKFDRPIVLRVNLKSFSQRRYQQSSKAKIIIAGMSKFLECYLDEGEYLAGKSTTVVFSEKMSLEFLLAVLNSKLLTFCYKNLFKSLSLSGGYMSIGAPQIANLPIKVPADTQQKEIGKLVDRMLALNKRLAPIRNTPSGEQEELLREIRRTDTEIDQKVYELYDLTEEERQVIETSLVSKP